MTVEGWVKIHRALSYDPSWTAEPFTRGQAWVDLIMLANHADGHIRVRGTRIEVRRGQVGWSEVQLAKRWKWSRDKVRRWFAELASETIQQIIQQKNNVSSIITLVNYERYQQNNTADVTADRQQTRQQTDSRQDTNKNEKKNKNEKNEKKGIFIIPSLEDISIYCQERKSIVDAEKFHAYYESNGWMVGKNKMRNWKAAMRTWEKSNYGGNYGSGTFGSTGTTIKKAGRAESDGVPYPVDYTFGD